MSEKRKTNSVYLFVELVFLSIILNEQQYHEYRNKL